jgi:succinate-acetate transporter protein
LKDYAYSPLCFAVACYGFGTIPFALLLMGFIPDDLHAATFIHGLLFSGIGQFVSSMMFRSAGIDIEASLFRMYSICWMFIYGFYLVQGYNLFQVQELAIIALIVMNIRIIKLTPSAFQGAFINGLLYALAFVAILLHTVGLAGVKGLLGIAGFFYLLNALLALFKAASEFVIQETATYALPVHAPLLNPASELSSQNTGIIDIIPTTQPDETHRI